VAVASAGQYADLHLAPDRTMPEFQHSVIYRPDALLATQDHPVNSPLVISSYTKYLFSAMAAQYKAGWMNQLWLKSRPEFETLSN